MFTIKFIKHYEDSTQEDTTCVSCPTYEAIKCSDGNYRIVLHKGFVLTEGVEYTVGDVRPNSYDVCYVENELGKTIAHYAPPPSITT